MKITFVSALTLDNDLHKTRELEMIKALADRGHVVTLLAITSKNKFNISYNRVKIICVPIRYVPIISPLVWAGVLAFLLPFYLLYSKPDYIVTGPDISVPSLIPSCLALKFLKTKFCLDIKSTPVEVAGARGRFLEILFNISVGVAKRMFGGIAFVTSSMKDEVCKEFGLDQARASVWTNGVSLDLFDPKNSPKLSSDLREKLGLSNKFVIFYHGVFSQNRGLLETVDAMRIVVRNNPQIVLLLLGTGSIMQNLRRIIVVHNLEKHVLLHNPVDYEHVVEYISISDVCIVPLPENRYWRYQNALNLLEYLAMEKVVLATDIYANRIVVGNEPCSVYLHSVNPAEIAESINYTYINKSKLDDWGKSGRKIIERNYSWKKIAEIVEQYLVSIS